MAKRNAPAGQSTPATAQLRSLGIPFVAHEYVHDPRVTDFGREAAEALGVSQERVFKTLLAEVDGELAVAVVPVAATLDLKAFAQNLGGKKAAMAAPALAERKTGYVVGGISPIGQRTRLRTMLDASAHNHAQILVSGGKRGFDIELAPVDLLRATDGAFADIARVPR